MVVGCSLTQLCEVDELRVNGLPKVRRYSKPGSLDRESESVDIAPRASSTPCVVTVRDPGRRLTKQSDTRGCAGNNLGRGVCRVNEYYHAEASHPARAKTNYLRASLLRAPV